MIGELYEIIADVYRNMNQSFAVPLEDISEDTELRKLGIDSLTFVMIMLQIEQKYNVNLAADTTRVFIKVKDVIDAIKTEQK